MKNEKSNKVRLEKYAAMIPASTFIVDMEKRVATVDAKKGLLANINAKLLFSATRKGAKSAWT